MLKLVKQSAAEVVRPLKEKRMFWLIFLEAKRQKKMFIRRL